MKRVRDISIGSLVAAVLVIILIVSSAAILLLVISNTRSEALHEAENKARIILDRNLATHSYFSHELKPAVFPLADAAKNEDYFDPAWMSSTYAVREIDKIFHALNSEDYYYKECAINARSPENEADEYEAAFIKRLNKEPGLDAFSTIRKIDGVPYFTVLRRGEVMEQSCMRCHSDSEKAPAGLLEEYGGTRSFNRAVGDVVSAISIRVPLEHAFSEADKAAGKLSLVLILTVTFILATVYLILRKLVIGPINALQEKAIDISTDEGRLGDEVPVPPGRELTLMSEAFNRMSTALRRHLDSLEQKVDERTSELKRINQELRKEQENVTILRGMLPICASCKKIRDDKGYWKQIESYITEHSEAVFSHGLCPDCAHDLYPDVTLKKKDKDNEE